MLAKSVLHRFAPEPPPVGTLLCDRYRLDAALARGGTAIVYRATDVVLGEAVAVKVLTPDGAMATPEARESHLGFREEAISAMRLSHPMILRVFTYDQHPPWELLVMELVVGETLSHYVKNRPQKRLSPIETVQVGLECLEALDYAHSAGVVHNDIKPGNLLYTRAGGIKLCDFGLARLISARPSSRVVAGTPGYMSPEKLYGEPGDPRSDLFSVAATLYALGNGRLMVPREALLLDGWPGPPPSTHLPLALHEVLCTAAAIDPRDRYQTAMEMREALLDVRQLVLRQYALFAVEHAAPAEPPMSVEAPPPPPSPSDDDFDLPSSEPAAERAFDLVPATAPRATLPDAFGMARIAGGTLASAYGGRLEVAAFRLDRTPVTNGDWADFVRATGEAAPAHWLAAEPLPGTLDHPVTGVTYDQARRYAEYSGKRLPTCSEWEYAARSGGRAFPWGDEWDPARCSSSGGTAPVDAYPEGASADGVLDLVGNAWEWTDPDSRLGLPNEGYAWVLGGSYRHPCHVNGAIARSAVSVHKAYEYLGFRCALDEVV